MCLRVCVCVRVRVRVRARVRACVCVCMRERENLHCKLLTVTVLHCKPVWRHYTPYVMSPECLCDGVDREFRAPVHLDAVTGPRHGCDDTDRRMPRW